MSRAILWILGVAAASLAMPGCRLYQTELQPDAAELEHYKTAATQLEYPDSQTPLRPDLAIEPSPLAIGRDAPPEFWDLSLTEVLRLALTHSKVLSDVGGTVLQSPANLRTIQGPAITETDPRFGVDATLSAFDPVLSTSANFTGNHQAINNVFFGGGTRILEEDTAVMQTSITKRTAFGGTLGVTQNMDYDASNAPGNLYPHAYNTNWEVSAKQSWLQGGGSLFNRIYGPPNVPGVFSGVPGFANGVMVARINTDISLTEFEMGVRDLVSNVENAYWDLYFAYRDLDAKIAARDSALETWRRIHALFLAGRRGGEAEKEAEAREQYFRFHEEVQVAWFGRFVEGTRNSNGSAGGTLRGTGGVRVAERRLRMLAGLPINEGKLIRPCDEPRRAKVIFEWDGMLREALARRSELRRQKWVIKRRELELLASKNFLLPNFDTSALYRVQGFGENLIGGTNDPAAGTYGNAVANLYSGQFGYWQAGATFSMPLGFRRGHAAVRNAELQLTREKVVLEQQERAVVHALSDAIAEAERAYESTLTSYNRREAARQHLSAVRAAFEADKAPPEFMLDSERRLAEAEVRYFSSLVEYSLAIKNVHFEKGSLLDYNEIHLAEGQWPGKAYDDAANRDAARLANRPLNYVFTRPPLQVSSGPYQQSTPPLDLPQGPPASIGAPTPQNEGPPLSQGIPPSQGPPQNRLLLQAQVPPQTPAPLLPASNGNAAAAVSPSNPTWPQTGASPAGTTSASYVAPPAGTLPAGILPTGMPPTGMPTGAGWPAANRMLYGPIPGPALPGVNPSPPNPSLSNPAPPNPSWPAPAPQWPTLSPPSAAAPLNRP